MHVCDICRGVTTTHWATSQEPYLFEECGLTDVELIGIAVHTCPSCNVSVPVIPRMAELHRVISRLLFEKPQRLDGTELRFLRKFAGKSSKEFAQLLRIDPSTLSRAENDKADLGPSADQLARLIAATIVDAKEARSVALQLPDAAPDKWLPVILEPCSEGWKKAS